MVEIDEICVCKSPAFWLWIIVSRLTGLVLGFSLGTREDKMLKLAWGDVPLDYHDKPIKTDGWEAYPRFFTLGNGFTVGQHEICEKGSGGTSCVESWNTKWRQRQSGLVRRSCGVSHAIHADIIERFMILVEVHNLACIRKVQAKKT